MATHPYLYRRTSGTYYLRITVPKYVLTMNPGSSRDIRLSLHTPYRTEAIQLACNLRSQFYRYLDSFRNQRFTLSGTSFSRFITLKLKEMITQYRRDTETMSEEFIELTSHLTDKEATHPPENSEDIESTPEAATLTTVIEQKNTRLTPKNLTEIEGNGVRFKCHLPDNPELEKELAMEAIRSAFGGGNGGGNKPSGEYSVQFVFDQYITNKVETNSEPDENTINEHIQMLKTLIKLLGPETNYAKLTFEDGEQLCKDILKLKDSRFKDQTKAKPLSPSRAKKILGKFKGVSKYARKKGYNTEDIGLDLEIRYKRGSKNKSDKVFETESLVALFSGYPYTQTPLAKERDLWDFHFWALPIYLYTGARLNEICQLRVEDIKSAIPRPKSSTDNAQPPEPIYYFDIKEAVDENGVQTHFIKNEPSVRKTPIHKALIALGFLDFVKQRRKEAGNKAMLFEGLNFDRKNKYGKKFGDWFHGGGKMKAYRDICGVTQLPKPNVHSFRHTFIQEYRDTTGIDRTVLAGIVGHDTDLQTDEYGGDTALHVLKPEIDKVDFDIDLSHLDYQKFKRYRDKKGKI